MFNPFIIDENETAQDNELISQSLDGDKAAISKLIARHQAWIYNIAFRMVLVAQDAEDITQEILIKMVTKLSSYDSTKASFRTWLYRIAKNHVINMQKAGYEKSITTADQYYSFIETTPDEAIQETPETKMIIEDLAISCTMGVLLCLERQQRLVFILGVVFNVNSEQGGEIMDMSAGAFRKTLSRARTKLFSFMSGKCGLVNGNAPCKCRNKVSEFIKQGWYSVDNLKYYKKNPIRVREIVSKKMEGFKEVFSDFNKLYQDHPFYDSLDLTGWLKETLQKDEFKNIFELT
jgi:RNA polymerase sigma factor (sigma-70 family)